MYSSPLKTLQLISSAGFFGAESVILELAGEFGSLGVENTIGVFENSQNPHIELAERAEELNLKTVVFRCNGRFDMKTMLAIKRFVKKNGIDMIHSHGAKSNAYGYAAARATRKPVVSTCHNWIENSIVDGSMGKVGSFISKNYYALDRLLLPRFDGVIAVSDDVKTKLIANKVPPERVSVINNGVGLGKFKGGKGSEALRDEFQIGSHVKVVGTVARLTEEKGLSNLLEAARAVLSRFKDSLFFIVGDGPLKEDLEAKSRELGIRESVVFAGQRSDIPAVYSAIDIFVLPSLIEGLPMVVLEAMAARRPVIASSVGAIPKVIADGKEGVLVKPGDVKSLGYAIASLLDDDAGAREMAENAYRRVAEDFSSRAMCRKHVEFYNRLLH